MNKMRERLIAWRVVTTSETVRDVTLGVGARISPFCNLYECVIGADTFVGPFVEITSRVVIGARCKIQSHTFICAGVKIEDDVFVGHGVMFTNDRYPKVAGDWKLEPTLVRRGASIGSGAVVLPGVTIGAGAMVGAGAVVVRDVPDGATVVGNPAREIQRFW